MYVFIDESGDTSVSRNTQSLYFTIGMVIFLDRLEVIKSCDIINSLSLEINHDKEFKFSNSNKRKKDRFFEAISPLNFTVRSLTIDKTVLIGKRLAFSNSQLYSNWLRMFISRDPSFTLG